MTPVETTVRAPWGVVRCWDRRREGDRLRRTRNSTSDGDGRRVAHAQTLQTATRRLHALAARDAPSVGPERTWRQRHRITCDGAGARACSSDRDDEAAVGWLLAAGGADASGWRAARAADAWGAPWAPTELRGRRAPAAGRDGGSSCLHPDAGWTRPGVSARTRSRSRAGWACTPLVCARCRRRVAGWTRPERAPQLAPARSRAGA